MQCGWRASGGAGAFSMGLPTRKRLWWSMNGVNVIRLEPDPSCFSSVRLLNSSGNVDVCARLNSSAAAFSISTSDSFPNSRWVLSFRALVIKRLT